MVQKPPYCDQVRDTATEQAIIPPTELPQMLTRESCVLYSGKLDRASASSIYLERVEGYSLLNPALQKLPKWFHRVFGSIRSTTRTLIRPNSILESCVLRRNMAVICFHRCNRRDVRIRVERVECAVHERRVRKASLNGLINVQDIRMLVQRVRIEDRVVGKFIHVARAVFGHGAE